MKIIIERHVCDACGMEMKSERHYMINLGVSDSWDEDAVISEQLTKKDLCHDCYKTIMSLIGEQTVDEKRNENQSPCKRTKGNYDVNLIKKLWAKGYMHKQIVAMANCKIHHVNYVISKMTDEEKQKLKDTYSVFADVRKEESDAGIEFTMDANGMITSIK